MLTVLLATAAAAALAAAPSHRRVFPAPQRARRPPPVRAAAVMCGAGLAWVLGGVIGPVVGTGVALLGPRVVGGLDRGPDVERAVAASLPVALDLLAACLVGGASLPTAVQVVALASPGALGERLRAVAAALLVGAPPTEAWRALGAVGPAGIATRALVRSADGGAPVAAAVRRVAAQTRAAQAAAARERARRAGILVVGPLGLCFLPAFVLLGIVPAVLGLAAPVLGGL